LPNAVVDVDPVDLFNSALVNYDYIVNLAGAGDRSEYDIESY